eukprot:gene27636-6960_t
MGRSVVLESDALAAKTADLPEPGHDEVLVRVLACGVSPINLQTTKIYKSAPQVSAGYEVVGEVEKVGSHVTSLFVGDQVAAFLPPDARESGYGEFTIVSASWASVLLPGVQPRDCAAALRAGIQAYTALHYQARLTAGDTVLVCNAAAESRQVI